MPRFYYSEALDTSQIQVRRRISVIFKDVPGGQKLGPKFDDIHRLLDFKLAVEGSPRSSNNRHRSSSSPLAIAQWGYDS
ncbi:MAG: carbon-phosphorus lyase complex subunit PhnI [Cyanobacteria bacterium J06642_2]